MVELHWKQKGHQFDKFVVIGGTVSCCNDNLQYLQWWQSCQIDDLLFSVYAFNVSFTMPAFMVAGRKSAWI